MFELKTIVREIHRYLPASSPAQAGQERTQRRLMVVALTLLLLSLGFVLYRDRDFWFPDTQQAEEQQPQPSAPAGTITSAPQVVAQPPSSVHKKSRPNKVQSKSAASAVSAPDDASAPAITATRTVLPPLEVEVVAGDVHRTVQPGTNSVRVDLQPGSAPQKVAVPAAKATTDTAASVTSNAAARVQMSADTVEVV